ncbi:MAG: hypothetical protein M1834_001546 [Cirrosporium novae-zelandiae]|nr:MAG: hypothetical protein M1834_004063 [Cirrosporium novae-zelandiae]KAI9735531.1 MAG: hypothetical protein M1834_001546 [Cirrosporium novae-zelandiae]
MDIATPRKSLRIAVEGCGHGTLNAIYASIGQACKTNGWDGVDLLVIGGDFQAVRNAHDLNCMSVPIKYRQIGDFHEYYSGKRIAPYLTIFVGGNHEASNHLFELYYGGWVAPNIYYMGAANVVRLGPLRIAGLSGICKGNNYNKPHHERLPYGNRDLKSVYHVRELDVRKLLQIRTQVDVGISHDWPMGIEWKGDWKGLFKEKPWLKADANNGELGSEAAKSVMERLRPPYWFSAHLHIKYSAVVEHGERNEVSSGSATASANNQRQISETPNIDIIEVPVEDEQQKTQVFNDDKIDLDMDDDDINDAPPNQDQPPPKQAEPSTEVPDSLRAQLPASFSRHAPPQPSQDEPLINLAFPSAITNKKTRFLALDKCLPKRKFLQILELEPHTTSPNAPFTDPPTLQYDKEWLAITRVFASDLTLGDFSQPVPPKKGEAFYRERIEKEEEWVEENIIKAGKMSIPQNFTRTAPPYDPQQGIRGMEQPPEYSNPQTEQFCGLVGIENKFCISEEERAARVERYEREKAAEGQGQGQDSGFRGHGRGGWRGRGNFRGGRRGRGGRGGRGGGGGRGRG